MHDLHVLLCEYVHVIWQKAYTKRQNLLRLIFESNSTVSFRVEILV